MSGTPREFPRFAIEATVDFSAPGLNVTGRTSNVSRGGLAATVSEPIEPGTNVTVRLALVFEEDTFSEPLDLPARVVWCTQLGEVYQLGSAFLGLSSDQRGYLGMFLRYLEEGQAHARAAAKSAEAEPDLFG
ncbi:PilZ domain-containing protein [Haliangium sp.]|uniref:PilZ domain-containing protein n=1 Tax=Haliangium sp. TaxID=2663208 RepID=UPI003D0B6302